MSADADADIPVYSQARGSDQATKYATARPQILRDPGPVAFTDHAAERYRDRTPWGAVPPRTAWDRGAWLEHPQLCRAYGQPELDKVRVYKDASGWGVTFLIVEDPHYSDHPDYVRQVVATCNTFDGYDHAPTRAYLYALEPHGGGEA
jgi:hypothetical protein